MSIFIQMKRKSTDGYQQPGTQLEEWGSAGLAEIESRVSKGRQEYRKGGFHGNIKTIPGKEIRLSPRIRMKDREASQAVQTESAYLN